MSDNHVTDASFRRDVLEHDKPIMVEFWAEWCGPCRAVSPVLDAIAAENSDTLSIVKLNVDDNPETAMKYGITSIPAMYVFDKGEVVKRVIGAKPKPSLEADLAEFLTTEAPTLAVDEEVAVTWFEGRFRLVSVSDTGEITLLEGLSGLHELLYIADPRAAHQQDLIDEFEDLMNKASVKETEIQAFLERNTEFLIGHEYSGARGHVVLERNEDGPLIPDFVLEPLNSNGLADLAELKLPKSKIFVEEKNRTRLSGGILRACAQLREYSDYFESEDRRVSVEDRHGLRIFRPRLYVVIGRRNGVSPLKFRAAERDLNSVRILTYDDLLERAQERLRRPY